MAPTHKQVDETVEDDLHIELGPLKIRSIRRWLSFTALAAVAVANDSRMHHVPQLTASASQMDLFREVTGEDILAMTERSGGTIIGEPVYDEAGLITSITASIPTAFEYDYSEMSAVIDSLYASVAPKKLLGDLAQTSVMLTGGQQQVVGLVNWTIDWKRKTADSTTTDDAEYEGATGSTKSWTVSAEYMFIDGDTSQQAAIADALTNTDDGVKTWNFFPTIEAGRTAWQGKAIVDGIKWGSGMGKVLGTSITLKGTGPLLVLAQAAPVANATTVTGQSAQVPES